MALIKLNNQSFGSGAIDNTNLPSGTVLQVVNSTGTDTTVNTSTPTTISSLSITPSSTSSKIFVIFSGHGNANQTGGWHKMQIYRDSTGVGNLLTFENAGGTSVNIPVVNQVLDTQAQLHQLHILQKHIKVLEVFVMEKVETTMLLL